MNHSINYFSISVSYPQDLYKDLHVSMEQEPKLLTKKLSVLEALVSYWFYDEEKEITEIIKFLMKILEKPSSCKKSKSKRMRN